MRIFDISVPLSADLPTYPGDPVLEILPVQRISRGDSCNLSRIIMSSHCGTHIDAPRHFVEEGATVDQLPLDILVGRVRVIEVPARGDLTDEVLHRLPVAGNTRILLKTSNSPLLRRKEFSSSYVSLTEEGAKYLVATGVRLVGVDYLSVEKLHGEGDVHRILLEAGVVLVESLDLTDVPAGEYELICLPLRIAGGDGAPARAILVSRTEGVASEFDPHTTRWPLS